MSITANSPQPRPPKTGRGSALSWIFFLLVLARPVWSLLRSMVAPQIGTQTLAIILIGVVALAIVGVVVARSVGGDTTGPMLPGAGQVPRALPAAQLPRARVHRAAPLKFEPMITRKVVVAWIALAGLFGAGFLTLFLVLFR